MSLKFSVFLPASPTFCISTYGGTDGLFPPEAKSVWQEVLGIDTWYLQNFQASKEMHGGTRSKRN